MVTVSRPRISGARALARPAAVAKLGRRPAETGGEATMRILHLEGTPARMGEAFGESCREAIGELYALRLENALAQALRYGGRRVGEEDLLALAEACLAASVRFDPDGAEELRGIARGAGLSADRVLAMNGLTDLRDALAWGGPVEAAGGCTAFVVQRDRSADGRLWAGQTWDLGTDNQPYVLAVHRAPARGPETWCVTTAGCLSLMGINAAGVAIGTTNLRTTDAGPGVPYLSVIHRALAESSALAAAGLIAHAPRAGGHAYTVVDRGGDAFAVECTARRARTFALRGGFHVHTNHCQVPEHQTLEADISFASSRARLARMQELLREADQIDGPFLESCLADRANGPLAICRDDFEGISTNAALVACPEGPSLRACAGLPSRGGWVDLVG
jgi:isopenicillin-N N-acyltransferase-like protein